MDVVAPASPVELRGANHLLGLANTNTTTRPRSYRLPATPVVLVSALVELRRGYVSTASELRAPPPWSRDTYIWNNGVEAVPKGRRDN